MENQLSQLYNELAQKLISAIPTKWEKIYFLGEVEKGRLSCSSIFYFIDCENGKAIRSHNIPQAYSVSEKMYNKFLFDLNNVLLKLYDCFAENEQELWEQFTFYLNDAGKFDANFKYDIFHENDGGQSRREIIWAYETFGYKPKEGTYFGRILCEYLNEKNG